MNFIAKARKKAGLSQAALAEKLEVAAGTIVAWELIGVPGEHATKPHKFKLSRLPDVAKALRVSRADLERWWMAVERAS